MEDIPRLCEISEDRNILIKSVFPKGTTLSQVLEKVPIGYNLSHNMLKVSMEALAKMNETLTIFNLTEVVPIEKITRESVMTAVYSGAYLSDTRPNIKELIIDILLAEPNIVDLLFDCDNVFDIFLNDWGIGPLPIDGYTFIWDFVTTEKRAEIVANKITNYHISVAMIKKLLNYLTPEQLIEHTGNKINRPMINLLFTKRTKSAKK